MSITCVVAFSVGCADSETPVAGQKAETQQKDSGPKTLDEAVKQLVALDQTIRTAFAEGDADTAHGPLHEVGHLLENIATLAKSDAKESEQKPIQDAVDKLFELYGTVDQTMHGKEGRTYDEVSAEIDDALKTLTNQAASEKGTKDEATE